MPPDRPTSGSDVIPHPAYRSDPGRTRHGRPGKGLSLAGLALRQLRVRGTWTASLALGLTLAFALASAFPLAGVIAADAALQAAVSGSGGKVLLTVARQRVPDQPGFESTEVQVTGRVEGRLGPYLAGSSALATLGPLTPVSLNENPAPALVDSSRLAVGYLRDLAGRVELVAGAVPPDGLGGSADVAATMAQTEADALGLHLDDRLCLDFVAGGTRWCARVAGLWRPVEGGDPFRLEAARQVELVVGRYDFYRLMRLAAAPVATVGRQFYVDVNSIHNRDAGDLVSSLRELRRYFKGQGDLFDTSLDQAIDSFGARELPVRVASELLAASLAVLVLYSASSVAGHFLRLQRREAELIRARGWSRRRVKRFLMLQLAVLVVASMVVGFGLTAALAAGLGGTLFGAWPPWPDLSPGLDVVAAAAAAAALALLWSVLSGLAARTASGDPGQLLTGAAAASSGRCRRRWALTGLALIAGIALLAAVRLSRGPPPAWLPQLPTGSGAAVDWLTAVTALLAVLLLAVPAARSLPLFGRLAAGRRRRVSGSLAGWQIERRPCQHGEIAFLLTVAVTMTTFGGLAAVSGPRRGPELAAAAVLVAGALATLIVALFAYALHFRAIAGEREEEYAALLLSGLPGRELRRSLAVEQRAVSWQSLASGAVVGGVLAVALLPFRALTADLVAIVAVSGGLLVVFLAAVLLAGRVTRGGLGRVHTGKQLRVLL